MVIRNFDGVDTAARDLPFVWVLHGVTVIEFHYKDYAWTQTGIAAAHLCSCATDVQ